jgi:hypothetical protein
VTVTGSSIRACTPVSNDPASVWTPPLIAPIATTFPFRTANLCRVSVPVKLLPPTDTTDPVTGTASLPVRWFLRVSALDADAQARSRAMTRADVVNMWDMTSPFFHSLNGRYGPTVRRALLCKRNAINDLIASLLKAVQLRSVRKR